MQGRCPPSILYVQAQPCGDIKEARGTGTRHLKLQPEWGGSRYQLGGETCGLPCAANNALHSTAGSTQNLEGVNGGFRQHTDAAPRAVHRSSGWLPSLVQVRAEGGHRRRLLGLTRGGTRPPSRSAAGRTRALGGTPQARRVRRGGSRLPMLASLGWGWLQQQPDTDSLHWCFWRLLCSRRLQRSYELEDGIGEVV